MQHDTITPGASRRSFLGKASGWALAALSATPILTKAELADQAQLFGPIDRSRITKGDIDIIKFLAAAELVEADLWDQYCELAVGNPGFQDALVAIDPALIRYVCDDKRDEVSHANLLNAFLVAIGEEPISLEPFRTLPPLSVEGASNVGRITTLRNLTVDTSWYLRYRASQNPDLGFRFPQFIPIRSTATVPTSDSARPIDYRAAAHAAAFHFGAIEQGGGSLYTALQPLTTSPQVSFILSSIGPTEIYHFTAFHKSLEGLPGLITPSGIRYPDLRNRPDLAHRILPTPCAFLEGRCSIIRPGTIAFAGAAAAANGLASSGLFEGQSQSFFEAVTALATAADAAIRVG